MESVTSNGIARCHCPVTRRRALRGQSHFFNTRCSPNSQCSGCYLPCEKIKHFTHSFNKHLLCAYYVPGTVLSIADTSKNKTEENACP